MKRNKFLKLITLGIIGLPTVVSSDTTVKSTYEELTPFPNTKKFGIDVYYDNHTDSSFFYLCPNKETAHAWLKSFCTPHGMLEPYFTKTEMDGYYISDTIYDKRFWREPFDNYHPINNTWGDVRIFNYHKIKIKNELIIKRAVVNVSMGFSDNAAPVYNDTKESRDRWWKRNVSDKKRYNLI